MTADKKAPGSSFDHHGSDRLRVPRSFGRIIPVLLILLTTFVLSAWTPRDAQRIVRVGAYDNPPKIFMDDDGNIAGFWPELVNYIAEKENWQIVWVYGTWDESLSRLAANEIDIMPDTGWTTERNQLYAFSEETVLVSWARLYVPQGSEVETILDLDGKKVAGLNGSLNFDGPEGIKQLAREFDVQCTFVGMDSYEEVFQALQEKEVDAGVANKDFGDSYEGRYDIKRTPVILQPTSILFAFTRDAEATPYFIETIDADLKILKSDSNSIYYQALDKYLSDGTQASLQYVIPSWIYVVIGYAGVAIFSLVVMTLLARKQIRERTATLRASETRNRVMVENNPDMILRLNGRGTFLDFHNGQETSYLLKTHEFIGKSVEEVLGPGMAALTRTKIRQALDSKELQTYEYQVKPNGDQYDLETRMIASGDDEVIAIIRDITARKRFEKDLRESEIRYQTLTTVVPTGIFRTDKTGYTTYLNQSWCDISGIPAADALGDGWLKAVHPEDIERVRQNWRESTKKNRPSTADYRFVRPDGSVAWVIGQAVPERDASGKVIGYVGAITDITERKSLEGLREAVIKAESADKMKSVFLATMSHELRTPLNSIIGFTGILLQKMVGPLSEEQEKQLLMVQGSARHLLDLINDVLDISKIEAEQMTILPVVFDMRQSIENCVERIKPFAEKKGLTLSTDIATDDLHIYSDQRRIEQILLNLLNNAVKFTEAGEVRVTCRVKGKKLVTGVSDTGIGISKENLAMLFKPFSQVETGLSRVYQGTGLGLSICKSLANLLGGQISVESEPGKGSTFSFTLPFGKGEHIE